MPRPRRDSGAVLHAAPPRRIREGETEKTFEFIRMIKRVHPATEVMITSTPPLPRQHDNIRRLQARMEASFVIVQAGLSCFRERRTNGPNHNG